jgi:hypothetical protein
MGGQLSDFLYQDPNDNTVAAVSFGTGNGTQTIFQLTRPIGVATDIVQNLNGTPLLFINGAEQTSGYTISTTGQVTFTTAPASGAALTWSGSYYYRVRFANAGQTFEQFMSQIWSSSSIKLQSVIL